jgi:hypothetical protein
MKLTFITECEVIYKVIIIFYVTLNSAGEVESFHLIILLQGLQQVHVIMPHLNAPDRGLRQA